MIASRSLGVLVVALLVLVVGCSKTTSGSADSDDSITESSEVSSMLPDPADPPQETGGPEPPQPPRPPQPSLDLAKLPIGGNAEGDGRAAQCAHVSLLVDIPHGVLRIKVTGAAFSTVGIFRAGGDGCGDQQPSCTEFSAKHTECFFAAVQIKDSDDNHGVRLTLSGTVICGDRNACLDFAGSAQPGSISFFPQPGVVESSGSNGAGSTSTTGTTAPSTSG